MIRFDSLPPEVMQAMCTPMHQILPPSSAFGASTGSLYLGSLAAVIEKDLLRDHHISHVIEVLDEPWLPTSEQDGVECYRINIVDSSAVDLKPHLEAACNHIDRLLRNGRNVLVHCHQGVSRSASIVIAYLIRNRGMTFDNAYAYAKRKRPCVKPNAGFMQALQEWEAIWRRPTTSRRFTS